MPFPSNLLKNQEGAFNERNHPLTLTIVIKLGQSLAFICK